MPKRKPEAKVCATNPYTYFQECAKPLYLTNELNGSPYT
jgi:hypothetical protein